MDEYQNQKGYNQPEEIKTEAVDTDFPLIASYDKAQKSYSTIVIKVQDQ